MYEFVHGRCSPNLFFMLDFMKMIPVKTFSPWKWPPLCSGVTEVQSQPKSYTFHTVILAVFAPCQDGTNIYWAENLLRIHRLFPSDSQSLSPSVPRKILFLSSCRALLHDRKTLVSSCNNQSEVTFISFLTSSFVQLLTQQSLTEAKSHIPMDCGG